MTPIPMPIGTLDIPVVAGNATALVDSLFVSPPGTPLARPFLAPLMQLANASSAFQALGGATAPFFNLPPAPPAVLPATALPNPAATPVQPFVSLLNPPELQAMLDTWWQIWSRAPGAPAPAGANASDVAFLDLLRDYLANPDGAGAMPPYSLWVPNVLYDGMQGEQLKLRLLGYAAVALQAAGAWQAAAVQQLFTHLAFGAHFVVIQAASDLPPAPPAPRCFYTTFANALGTQSRWARAHSHYSGSGPGGLGRGLTNLLAAYAYPGVVNSEVTPANCPYLAALLIGRTAWGIGGDYNTFFQLEGWPTTGLTGAGGRHGADFAAHTASKWNISTYGASLFSEKRGTTVFLAPPAWNPQPNAATIMAPYAGAKPAAQGWLDQALIRL